ncbi:hypothetical protein DACRYDRAFT_92650 [Dacryopinax primogenitus]|uniref:BHLH domain-containing protein n=1 Tax=Dacryopinax primogenitus (strain DJM 731) TaxID=1858805 RepID=M5G942_DACPD|nr:uncharacterized protein DACRYDRAFT_92650 [Dacryopinax primogenitus]EJU05259.1 hypothetical protein DACRYDRAFT_92650 [Dacryopinax primogenitus]
MHSPYSKMSTIKQSPNGSPVPRLSEGAQGLAPLQTDTASDHFSNPPSAVPSSAVTESGLDSAIGPMRRKPSRRANTAERRATHNAVERQRRETLNGRFLDLAAMLPNLQSVRRPSKSAIVNSSIALIHQQRRARGVAARELRLLKSESDILRREVNEWRERARMPPVEEPIRSQDFHILMTVEEVEENEEERAAYAAMNAVDEADEDEYGDGPDELSDRPTSGGRGAGQGLQYNHNMNHGMGMAMGMMPIGMGNMGMQMPPQRGYAAPPPPSHPSHQYGASQQQVGLDFSSAPTMFDSGQTKAAAWTQQQQQQLQQQQQQQQQMINMMQNQNQQMQSQQWPQAQLAQPVTSLSMFTPPGSSHGSSVPAVTTPPASDPLVQQAQEAFLANYQRNAQVLFPGPGTSISALSGIGYQAPTTQAITPPSSMHDGDAGVCVSAPMVTDGMNSVHSSPSGSIRSNSASVHSNRASPEANFSLSPPIPVTAAFMNSGMTNPTVPFVSSHSRRTSSGGLAVPQPAPAIGTTVGMPWLTSNMNMGVTVGSGYASSGLSLFA